MQADDLARRRELLIATANLQRTKLRIEWLVLRERGSSVVRRGPLVVGTVLAVAMAVRVLLRPRARSTSAAAGGGIVVPLLRLLIQVVALARLWRAVSGR